MLAIGRWHLEGGSRFDRRAFLWSAGVMAGIGAVLDVAFGHSFFAFPNQAATLGLRLPAWSWSAKAFVGGYLPIEEFGFYILGAIFMAATYLWAAQYRVPQYGRHDYHDAAQAHPRIIRVSWWAVALWALALGAGLAYRAWTSGGFAGYYTFVLVGGALPTIVLIRTVKHFVNWHAMAFAMMGIYIHGWNDLPLEAVLIWIVGVWDAVLIYEFFRIFLRMEDRTVRRRLFGLPAAEAE